MEPKLPLEVTYGDVIQVPVAMVNATKVKLTGTIDAKILGTALIPSNISDMSFALNSNERSRRMLTLTAGSVAETAQLTLSASSKGFSDKVTRSTQVAPSGFPFTIGDAGLLEANSVKSHKFNIPAEAVANSYETLVQVFSTPASSLTEALKGLIREPCGCFEQTSTTTYPLVMVLQYFNTHLGVDPKLVESANEKLTRGYKKLTSYECKSGGYEWFGSDPAHEGNYPPR